MKGKLYTTYFASKKSKGIKLAVTRFKPKWLDFKKEEIYHIPQLSPSQELLLGHKEKCKTLGKENVWDYYVIAFKREIETREDMKDMLEKVQGRLYGGADITLICYEKDQVQCHRHLLGEYFKNLGYEVEEL